MATKNKTKRKYTKKPVQKTVASPYFSSFIPGASPYLDTYGKTSAPTPYDLVVECLETAYACSTINAEAVASTPLRLYVRTTRKQPISRLMARGDVKSIDRLTRDRLQKSPNTAQYMANATDCKEVTEHPMLELLDNPLGKDDNSTGMSRFMLLEMIQRYLEIVGRSYWYVVQEGPGGTPSELWVLPSHLVIEWPDYSQETVIKEYQYLSGIHKNTYSPEEVVPFRFGDLATGGLLGGFSPLRGCFESVKIFRQFSAHTNAVLLNSGRPSAIFVPSGQEGYGIGKDEAARMQAAFKQTFAQAGAGGVLVSRLPGNLEMMEWPTDKIVNSSQYQQTKNAVANCFGVPTTKLDTADSTLASAKTGDYSHAKDAVVPRLRRIESVLNQFYVPYWDTGHQLFFAFDDPIGLKDDEREQQQWQHARENGAILINEERAQLRLDPVPWGDQPMVPGTQIAIDKNTGLPMAGERPAAASSSVTVNSMPKDQEEKDQEDDADKDANEEEKSILESTTAIIKLCQEVTFGNITRQQGIATAQFMFKMSEKDARKLFPEPKIEVEEKAVAAEGTSGNGGYATPVQYNDNHQHAYDAAKADMPDLNTKVPHPHKDEKEQDFISRCVADPELVSSFSDQSQRLGICYTTWRHKDDKQKILKSHKHEGKKVNLKAMSDNEMVEYNTSSSMSGPCDACVDMDGKTMTVAEAKSLIPQHNNCVCWFIEVGSRDN